MQRATVFMILSILMFCDANAQDETSRPEHVLRMAEERLRTALADVSPAPLYEHPGANTLVVKYKARKFMVHGSNLQGRFSEKAHETDGPSYTGFILTVRVQPAGVINMAGVPQTLEMPYWRTDLDVTMPKGLGHQLFWGLSYGNRPDQRHLKKIKDVFHALGKDAEGDVPTNPRKAKL